MIGEAKTLSYLDRHEEAIAVLNEMVRRGDEARLTSLTVSACSVGDASGAFTT